MEPEIQDHYQVDGREEVNDTTTGKFI